MLLYIHGFQSSPKSFKAQQTEAYLRAQHPDIELITPQLPVYPQDALALLESIIAEQAESGGKIGLIGSSLGGFFALNLAQRFDLRAVLINPSVYPFETIAAYLGDLVQPYTGEHFSLTKQHMADLQQMQVELQADEYQNFLLLLQTGDETLDFSKASAHLHSVRSVIEYGGDHSFVGFERWLPEVIRFLRL